MNSSSQSQFHAQFAVDSRSMGVKLLLVCGLALLMLIPALFVFGLVGERKHRQAEVMQQISAQVGGRQTFLGPVLAIPYTVTPQQPGAATTQGLYLVFPTQGSANVQSSTQQRQRSLFNVPVFEANLKFNALFDLTGVPNAAPENAVLNWSQAEIVVGVSDPRGALSDAELTANGTTSTLAPSTVAPDLTLGGGQNPPLRLVMFGAPAGSFAKPNAKLNVQSSLHFSGAQRIAILAYGKTTQVTMQGDWPSPGFDGGFLPIHQAVTPHGFTAQWSVPYIARGVAAEGPASSIHGLAGTALGVSFVEVANPYQSVTRSLKYVPLFLGLIFLTYFIFEATTGKRIHPAQYVLVGIGQIIFYLLLLSFSERIGFGLAFLVAGAATVILLSANAGWIFASRLQGVRALGTFSGLYVLIYLLLRLKDNALMVGALASFAAVAAAMYLTRGINWYSSLPEPAAGGAHSSTPPTTLTQSES
jgi:inner membrane protein